MSHASDEKLAAYINKFYTPQDLKITRKIFPRQTDMNGTCMVYLRLRRYDPQTRKDIKEKKMPTGVRVKPKSWGKKKEVLQSDFEHSQKNRKIQELESDIRKYISSPDIDYKFAQLKKEEFPLIEQIFPTERILKHTKHLVHYIEEYHERRDKLKHPHGTIKEFKTVMNRVKRFDDDNNRITYLKDIDILWSDDFELWMTEKEYASGTIEKTYVILKTVLRHYWERRKKMNIQMVEDFTFTSFKRGEKSKNEPNPLSKEQVLFLYKHRFKGEEQHLETTRKMAMVQCLTGCRYDDIKKFRPKHFEKRKGWVEFTPTKTAHLKEPVIVEQPLNKYAKALFKELDYNTSTLKMQNQPYNRRISDILKILAKKEECKKLKFKTNHTSHNFRDTYISQAVESGVNFKSILKWVGQSSYKIMDRYIKTTNRFNVQEMRKMYKVGKGN